MKLIGRLISSVTVGTLGRIRGAAVPNSTQDPAGRYSLLRLRALRGLGQVSASKSLKIKREKSESSMVTGDYPIFVCFLAQYPPHTPLIQK